MEKFSVSKEQTNSNWLKCVGHFQVCAKLLPFRLKLGLTSGTSMVVHNVMMIDDCVLGNWSIDVL